MENPEAQNIHKMEGGARNKKSGIINNEYGFI